MVKDLDGDELHATLFDWQLPILSAFIRVYRRPKYESRLENRRQAISLRDGNEVNVV